MADEVVEYTKEEMLRAGELARELVTLHLQHAGKAGQAKNRYERRFQEIMNDEDPDLVGSVLEMMVNYVRAAIGFTAAACQGAAPSPMEIRHLWHRIAEIAAMQEQEMEVQ